MAYSKAKLKTSDEEELGKLKNSLALEPTTFLLAA
jgi:hypothetical protein